MRIADYWNVKDNDTHKKVWNEYQSFYDGLIFYENDSYGRDTHVDKLNDMLERLNPDMIEFNYDDIINQMKNIENEFPDINYE